MNVFNFFVWILFLFPRTLEIFGCLCKVINEIWLIISCYFCILIAIASLSVWCSIFTSIFFVKIFFYLGLFGSFSDYLKRLRKQNIFHIQLSLKILYFYFAFLHNFPYKDKQLWSDWCFQRKFSAVFSITIQNSNSTSY